MRFANAAIGVSELQPGLVLRGVATVGTQRSFTDNRFVELFGRLFRGLSIELVSMESPLS